MKLNKIFEEEDITSLELIDSSRYPKMDQEIIDFCVENNTFDCSEIFTKLSKDHFKRYMDLRDDYAAYEFKKRLEKHLNAIQNLPDTTPEEKKYLSKGVNNGSKN